MFWWSFYGDYIHYKFLKAEKLSALIWRTISCRVFLTRQIKLTDCSYLHLWIAVMHLLWKVQWLKIQQKCVKFWKDNLEKLIEFILCMANLITYYLIMDNLPWSETKTILTHWCSLCRYSPSISCLTDFSTSSIASVTWRHRSITILVPAKETIYLCWSEVHLHWRSQSLAKYSRYCDNATFLSYLRNCTVIQGVRLDWDNLKTI